jgi:nucleotide-binding universal stress UspA family protein
MLPPKLIMSPIDFSEPSDEALKIAVHLANLYKAELCLVHVVPAIPTLPSFTAFVHEGQYEDELVKESRRRLEEIAAKLSEQGLKVRVDVGMANEVGMELLRIAEHNRVDIIVISTHGMTGWHRLAFGSVTEKVVRLTSCPVLVLRAQPEAKSHDASKTEPVEISA